MIYSQTINLYQDLIATSEALTKAAKGLRKIAKTITKTSEIDPDQAWYWTKVWQKMEKEANEDYLLGRYTTYDSVDDLIASLDKAAKKYRRAHNKK